MLAIAHPAKALFHHPAAGEQHKPALRLRQFNYRQVAAVLGCHLPWRVPGVSLVYMGQGRGLAGRYLNRLRQIRHLAAVLLVGGSHMNRQKLTQRIDCQVNFAPFLRLAPSYPAP